MLVTGGAGFIGSHLVEALLEQVSRLRVVDNLATGHRSNLAHLEGRYDWIEGDVADFDVCRRAVQGVSCIFHQAAIPSVPRSVREPISSHASGPTATLNLLEAARQAGARRFVFAASSSAYGDTIELPKHEDMLPSRSVPSLDPAAASISAPSRIGASSSPSSRARARRRRRSIPASPIPWRSSSPAPSAIPSRGARSPSP